MAESVPHAARRATARTTTTTTIRASSRSTSGRPTTRSSPCSTCSPGMAMALIGGYMAYVFRMQLAFPGMDGAALRAGVAGDVQRPVTNHGSIMIFWVAMPVLIAAFGNYLIPLMCGCGRHGLPEAQPAVVPDLPDQRDRPARLASSSRAAASAGAWTAYPPLSAKGSTTTTMGSSLWLIAVALEFVAFLLGGINFITTADELARAGHEGSTTSRSSSG